MADKPRPIRGTRDLLPADCRSHARVEEICRRVAERYGYGEIRTPILEATSVFSRTLGDATDVVQKEMYTFDDRNGDSITLRPENTAGVARAILSNALLDTMPLRLHYAGAMFRHERPQKGRYRQFHQTGVELFGVPEPLGDVEVITLARDVLAELGLLADTVLEINTLGDTVSRQNHVGALKEYFNDHRSRLSDISRERLERNPLRILDSKEACDRELVADAPVIIDYLGDGARRFFDQVLEGLATLSISCQINPRIVRGFDYYCHTAFEFVTGKLGAQGTVIGGGRYDGLMEQIGGPPVSGVGWASGIERLALLAGEPPQPRRPIAVIGLGEPSVSKALILAHQLRSRGHRVDLAYRGNLRRRMQRAHKVESSHAVILGDAELARGVALVRDLDSGEQHECALDHLGEDLPRPIA